LYVPGSCNILIQQNFGDSYFFERTWNELLVEQGQPSGDYWIGLETIHQLTKDGMYKLRLDIQARDGTWYWEEYDTFIVQDNSTYYYMVASGVVGNTGESGSMYYHSGFPFATFDFDILGTGCAPSYRSGWWYYSCLLTCFNCNRLPAYDTLFMYTQELGTVYLQSVSMRLICKSSTSAQQ